MLQTVLDIVLCIFILIDMSDNMQMLVLIKTSIGTKFIIRWSDLMCCLALDTIRTVTADDPGGVHTVNIKCYMRVGKVPSGKIKSSHVLVGVMLNKNIVHLQMRRCIREPHIMLLDCLLEYKKGESQMNIKISKEADFVHINQIKEEQIKAMVDQILEFNLDNLILYEKVFFMQNGHMTHFWP